MDIYDRFLNDLMSSPTIHKVYNEYIIKDITFKEWVVGMVDNLYCSYTLNDTDYCKNPLRYTKSAK